MKNNPRYSCDKKPLPSILAKSLRMDSLHVLYSGEGASTCEQTQTAAPGMIQDARVCPSGLKQAPRMFLLRTVTQARVKSIFRTGSMCCTKVEHF